MLTDRKVREDYMMLLTELEADMDAHRQEGQRRLHDAFNRTGGWEGCSQIGKDCEDYMLLLSEQEAETDAH